MNHRLTKAQLRAVMQQTDAGLADYFGISRAAVAQWGDEDPIPELRQLQVQARNPELLADTDPQSDPQFPAADQVVCSAAGPTDRPDISEAA